MSTFKSIVTVLIVTTSSLVHASDFSTADALFAKRDEGRQATHAARAAYQEIIDQGAKDADLLRAAEGLARTYMYEGTALLNVDVPDEKFIRKKLFRTCWNYVAELINPERIGFSSPLYWYLRANCLAYEAEVSNVLERLANLPKLNDAFEKGLAAPGGDIFEGGGIKRVKAAVKGNAEAKGLPGGLYNPTEALKIIDESIGSEAYPGNSEGFLFCENFRRKILILNEMGLKIESQSLAQSTAREFKEYLSSDIIPEVIRSETIYCVKNIELLR